MADVKSRSARNHGSWLKSRSARNHGSWLKSRSARNYGSWLKSRSARSHGSWLKSGSALRATISLMKIGAVDKIMVERQRDSGGDGWRVRDVW